MPQTMRMQRIVAICFILIATSQLVIGNPLTKRHRHKRSFAELGCKGIYEAPIFASVDQICEDCYNLMKEMKLHAKCRENCFTTKYYDGCIEVLRLFDERPKLVEKIRILNGLGVRDSANAARVLNKIGMNSWADPTEQMHTTFYVLGV